LVSAIVSRRLKVIYFRAAYNLPTTLGLERGVFARHGLELEITYTLGSIMICESLLSGEQDLGALAIDDVVYEVEKRNADLFAFMGYNSGTIQLMARPGIGSARALAGKKLGVDDPNSGFAFVAHKILQSLGLKRDEYETVPAGGHNHRAKALREGKIDAAVIAPPISVELTNLGFPTLGRTLDHLPKYQGSVGVTTRRWAQKNSDTLVAYIRAYRESLEWTLDPGNREACVAHLAKDFGLPPEIAGPTYDVLAKSNDGLYRDAHIDAPGIQTVLDLRVENGLLTAPTPDPAKYYDTSYLRRSG
jgi:ABC-type nitrate/sulfonate/bicarbonate transport system substrate-binding protein